MAGSPPDPENAIAASDGSLLDALKSHGAMSVGQLGRAMGVTATAVRQRLSRLMRQRLVERVVVRAGRGRPGHRYSLTEKGRRRGGSNFADLALALWNEVREIKDAEIRKGLLQRLARRMAAEYAGAVKGDTVGERMESLRRLFDERDVAFRVTTRREGDLELPVLTAVECPYPELAERDRSVCAMEKMLFAELVGGNLRLKECRLDGAACCTFMTG